MKKYLLDLIPKFKRLDKRLDDVTALINKHWIDYQEDSNLKVVWIFTQDPDILRISENGVIKKGAWAYLGNGKVELEVDGTSLLFHHEFHDDHLLAFVQDGTNNFKLLVSETFYSSMLEDASKIVDYVDRVLNTQEVYRNTDSAELKIGPHDVFNSEDFPQLQVDLSLIREKFGVLLDDESVEMIIHFVIKHSLKSIWSKLNPALFKALSAGHLKLGHLESIFNACALNAEFKTALSRYIFTELTGKKG